MKLFKMEVLFHKRRRRRAGVDILVHAPSRAAAEKHVQDKFPKCTIERVIPITGTVKFTLADIVEDPKT